MSEIRRRALFGTVHSYDSFLSTALLTFLNSMMSGDIDTAEEILLTLVAALPKEAKYDRDDREGAISVIRKYIKERNKLLEELMKCQTIRCKDSVRAEIKELLRAAFSKVADLMDEEGLLVRKHETRIPIH